MARAKEVEVVGHGVILIRSQQIRITFTDGKNNYRIKPYKVLNDDGIMFNVELVREHDEELVYRVKNLISQIKESEPVLAMRYKHGFYNCIHKGIHYIGMIILNNFILIDKEKYNKILSRNVSREVFKINDLLTKLQNKLKKV